ncbi:MAG: DUF5681 domain-containing protein [Sphingomonadales bacterium]
MTTKSRRMPPKEHQFPKGRSGNPRGRPPKRRQALIPSQISKEVLAALGGKVTIMAPSGKIRITRMELLIRSITDQAIKGKPTALRILLLLMDNALQDNVKRHPEYEALDVLEKTIETSGHEVPEDVKSMLDDLAKKSFKP